MADQAVRSPSLNQRIEEALSEAHDRIARVNASHAKNLAFAEEHLRRVIRARELVNNSTDDLDQLLDLIRSLDI